MNAMTPQLLEIAEAIEQSAGKTPAEILEAFLPKTPTIIGRRLVPLKLGHDLFLSKIGHPLAEGSTAWEPHDIAQALFVFTRPSRDLFAMMEEDTYLDKFHAFLDEIDAADLDSAATELLHHWFARKATSVDLESPHPSTQKKTADSAGGSLS